MKMKRQYYSPDKDGFYGAFYECPTSSKKAMILMLGDAIRSLCILCRIVAYRI